MSQSSGSQQQQTSSQTSPWEPTQPYLKSVIGNLSNQNTGVTPNQSSAVQNLQSSAYALPNFGPSVAGTAATYLNPLSDQNRSIINGVQQTGQTLSPYMQPNYTNPFSNPVLSSALQYMNQGITDNINSTFAAAGRDLSPANTKALAYGLGSADTNAAFDQYNNNVQAQQNATNQYLTSLLAGNQALQGNIGFGIQGAGNVPGFMLAPGQAQLSAANTGYNLPFSNIGAGEGLVLPIAGLGGQSQGTSNTQTSFTPSLESAFLAPFSGGGNSPFTNITSFANPLAMFQGIGNAFKG